MSFNPITKIKIKDEKMKTVVTSIENNFTYMY